MRSTARIWTIRFLPKGWTSPRICLCDSSAPESGPGWRTFTSVRRVSPGMVDRIEVRVSSPHGFGSLVSVASSITAAVAALDVMLHI